MEVTILENKKNKLTLELGKNDATIANVIRKELWNDDKVKVAGYNVDHPLTGDPKFFIETSGTTKAIDALKEALSRSKKTVKKLSKEISKLK